VKLINIVIEASRTGDNPRLNRRAAETVLRAIVEWVEEQPSNDNCGGPMSCNFGRAALEALAQRMRDEILIGRTPK
jgi:hypothetical protein